MIRFFFFIIRSFNIRTSIFQREIYRVTCVSIYFGGIFCDKISIFLNENSRGKDIVESRIRKKREISRIKKDG